MSRRTPTCVWRIGDRLVAALDERFGDPLDAYVNGSQTWLLDNGPGGITLEWRLHPVAGYRPPVGVGTYEVFPVVARAVATGEVPPAPPESLWDGLEAFPAHGDETEPVRLRDAAVDALGLDPDAFGLVDHDRIGDDWERSRGGLSIVDALLGQLTGGCRARPPAPAPAPASSVVGRAGPDLVTGRVEGDLHRLAPDGGEGERRPQPGAGQGRGQRPLGKPADVGALELVAAQRAARHPAVEDERVQRDAGEAQAQAVERLLTDDSYGAAARVVRNESASMPSPADVADRGAALA